MPTYEYRCEPCLKIYRVMHKWAEKPEIRCPECEALTERMISAPNLSLARHASPTAEKYDKMSKSEEIAREKEFQKTYETIWLPPEVKHGVDDDH